MLRGIRINDDRFLRDDESNVLSELTDNTIIICRNYEMMEALAKDIAKTVNGNVERHDYDCDDEDIGKARYRINFFLQKTIGINDQTITLCLEPAMVYKAKCIEDIWFLDRNWHNKQPLEQVYPMTIFNGAREVWEGGLDAVYTQIAIGRYGGYNGEWISDPRKHRAFL